MSNDISEMIKAFEEMKQADKIVSVILIIALVCYLGLVIWEAVMISKKKQWYVAYKASLNEEQLKAVERAERLKKW